MEKTWRWFGKKDKITLAMLRQIGVEGIVTALHDVPLGQVWTREKIRDLREYIESYGMRAPQPLRRGHPLHLLQLHAGAGLGPYGPVP